MFQKKRKYQNNGWFEIRIVDKRSGASRCLFSGREGIAGCTTQECRGEIFLSDFFVLFDGWIDNKSTTQEYGRDFIYSTTT